MKSLIFGTKSSTCLNQHEKRSLDWHSIDFQNFTRSSKLNLAATMIKQLRNNGSTFFPFLVIDQTKQFGISNLTFTGKLSPPWLMVTESFSQFWLAAPLLLDLFFLLRKLRVLLNLRNLSLNDDIAKVMSYSIKWTIAVLCFAFRSNVDTFKRLGAFEHRTASTPFWFSVVF